jgi:hypothetical protein
VEQGVTRRCRRGGVLRQGPGHRGAARIGFRPVPGSPAGESGQVRWNRASALPEAILVRSAGLGIASKNCPTAAASGWWKG